MKDYFEVNDYLSLKLQNRKTFIYVNGERFIQCKYLLIDIPIEQKEDIELLYNKDNFSDNLNELEYHNYKNRIAPELEFWGHCSNLQVWYEYNYDTRLLHRNLAFPLLKKLSKVGDLLAKKVFKEEVAKRFTSGNPVVVEYLSEEGYLQNFDKNEIQILLENIEIMQIIQDNPKLLFLILNKFDTIDLSGIKWLEQVKKIKELRVESYRLINLNGIEHFPNLEVLNLNDNKLIEIKRLESLRDLNELTLNRNQINKIEGLEKLTNLRELYFWNNQIEEIRGLENLKCLEILSLGGNKIEEIKGLENLINLKSLDLSYNQLTELKGLENLQNLQALDLQNNQLKDIKGLEKNCNLRELWIGGNNIPEIQINNLKSPKIKIFK